MARSLREAAYATLERLQVVTDTTSFPGLFVRLQQRQLAYAIATTGITLAALVGSVALRRGVSTDRGAVLHVTTLDGTFLGGLYSTGGLRSPLTSQCLLVIAHADIVLSKRAMIVCTGIFLVSTVALSLVERQGFVPPTVTPLDELTYTTVVVILMIVSLAFVLRSFLRSLKERQAQ